MFVALRLVINDSSSGDLTSGCVASLGGEVPQPGTYVTGERLGGALEMGRRDFYSAKDNYITSLNPVMRQH